MKPRLYLLLINLALVAAWLGSAAGVRPPPGRRKARKTPGYTRAHMRPATALTVLSCLLFAVGCGGSDDGATATDIARLDPRGALASKVTTWPSFRAANHEPGDVRVSFLVVDAKGVAGSLPTAGCRRCALDNPLPRDGGSSGSACREATRRTRPIYVAYLKLPRPGSSGCWRARGRQREGAGARERRRGEERRTPDVGDPAISSGTPTLVGGGDAARWALRRTSRSSSTRSPTPCRRRCRSSSRSRPQSSARAGPAAPSSTSSRRSSIGSTARRSLHPRRGLRGQRSGEWLQQVDAGVEPPDQGVDVPRRREREDRRPLRGDGVGEQARDRGARSCSALSSGRRRARPRCSACAGHQPERENRAYECDDVVEGDLVVVR